MTILDEAFIDAYSGYIPSPKLYPAIRAICHMQSIYAWRLMYVLHKLISEPSPSDFSLPLPPLIDALRIKESDPIGVILETVQRLSENPIQEAQRGSEGNAVSWAIEPWIYEAVLNESTELLHLRINPCAYPFFHSLSALDPVRPETCIRLSRGYPTWLYIVLTNASNEGKYWCIPITLYSKLSHLTAFNSRRFGETEYKKTFQTLGLKTSSELIKEEKLARKEKRSIHFQAMTLLKGGHLFRIRNKSELFVNVCWIKGFLGLYKLSVSHLAFSFEEQDELSPYGLDRLTFSKELTFSEDLANLHKFVSH